MRTTTLGAKVPGYTAALLADNNARVHAGQVIARIDDGDYRIALRSAREKAATQQATIDRFDKQILAQQAAVTQAKRSLFRPGGADPGPGRVCSPAGRHWRAGPSPASRPWSRHWRLCDQAAAAVRSADAAVDGASATVGVLRAQKRKPKAPLPSSKTAVAKAERDLAFTQIRAPIDGVLGNRAAQVGDFVQTGQRIAAVVPLKDVYIDANFKETQLARLRPGPARLGQGRCLAGRKGSTAWSEAWRRPRVRCFRCYLRSG